MTAFWEEAFEGKQEMWGLEPARSAVHTAELFAKMGCQNVLIPGIGYGRNASPFRAMSMEVTGIEISATAIQLAKKHYGDSLKIHHGSVANMPFDAHQYDGVYCHAVIHLLDENERIKLIADAHNQLTENGVMVFTAITKQSNTYGQGRLIGQDRYEQFGGVSIFFYDRDSIQNEFGDFGLFEVTEVMENYPFHLIKCKK